MEAASQHWQRGLAAAPWKERPTRPSGTSVAHPRVQPAHAPIFRTRSGHPGAPRAATPGKGGGQGEEEAEEDGGGGRGEGRRAVVLANWPRTGRPRKRAPSGTQGGLKDSSVNEIVPPERGSEGTKLSRNLSGSGSATIETRRRGGGEAEDGGRRRRTRRGAASGRLSQLASDRHASETCTLRHSGRAQGELC